MTTCGGLCPSLVVVDEGASAAMHNVLCSKAESGFLCQGAGNLSLTV